MFEFKIHKRNRTSKARTGEFTTPHGTLQTPALAIVGTEGQIKSIPPDITSTLPVHYAIVNTFHIWTKEIIKKIHADDTTQSKTVHQYGGFPHVVASDSGGFQVFSLGFGKQHNVGKHARTETGNINVRNQDTENPLIISEEGVTFEWNTTPETSQNILLTPELSMQLQHQIGADIIFAFDECTSPHNSKEYVAQSIERTDRWLARCVAAHTEGELTRPSKLPQALFAIVQGSEWEDLRVKSAKMCARHNTPGFGIGGSFGNSFGDSKKNMHQVLEWVMPHLPDEKPRHLLGIGQVDDLFECVERGVDLFDCVIPTREARHKVLYTTKGKVAIKKIKTSNNPIEMHCKCIACAQKITGEQLYEFFLQKDPRAFFYTTVHNIQFFADLMEKIRVSITDGTLSELKEEYLSYY